MLVPANDRELPLTAVRTSAAFSGEAFVNVPLMNIDPPLENVLVLPGCCQAVADSRRTPVSALFTPHMPSRLRYWNVRSTTMIVWTVLVAELINSSALGATPPELPVRSP